MMKATASSTMSAGCSPWQICGLLSLTCLANSSKLSRSQSRRSSTSDTLDSTWPPAKTASASRQMHGDAGFVIVPISLCSQERFLRAHHEMRSSKTGFVLAHSNGRSDFSTKARRKIQIFDAAQYPFTNLQTAIQISTGQDTAKLVVTIK